MDQSPHVSVNSGSSKISTMKSYFDLCDSVFKVLSRLTTTLGLLLTALYCIHINFYPKDLSAGDAMLFIFSIISFGMINVFGIIYGVISIFCVMRFIAWALNKFAKYRFSDEAYGGNSKAAMFEYREIRPIASLRGWFSVITSALTLAIFCLSVLAMVLSSPHRESVWNLLRLLASFAAGGVLD